MEQLIERQKLQEIGIDVWEVSHPERLQGFQSSGFSLPPTCVLLLVAESIPQGQDTALFAKVLASMKLNLDQALHVTPTQLSQINQHQLTWVWFCGTETETDTETKSQALEFSVEGLQVLNSVSLADIPTDISHRRQLWQQICSYQK
ncbi:DNA polymerase III subunit psi [Vibrio sp. S11_S32]|uniref:DNA polymerase III subunit psi n=2 Tax=Vibrionaceae TaxID=641 RepID=A0A5Q0TGQ8_9VIBR|nr:DNA polymerase III subunit psi [Vibrio sp. S11_S32]MBD1576112.1 DNA polymerase III subunit psi [Vibrio sp. S11_S32]